MNSDERESEEVDVTPFEGKPDFEDAPSTQTCGPADVDDTQDEEAGDA